MSDGKQWETGDGVKVGPGDRVWAVGGYPMDLLHDGIIDRRGLNPMRDWDEFTGTPDAVVACYYSTEIKSLEMAVHIQGQKVANAKRLIRGYEDRIAAIMEANGKS